MILYVSLASAFVEVERIAPDEESEEKIVLSKPIVSVFFYLWCVKGYFMYFFKHQ